MFNACQSQHQPFCVATTRKKVQDEMQFCSQLQKLKTRT